MNFRLHPLTIAMCFAMTSTVLAQEAPPAGPADVINSARQATDQAESDAANRAGEAAQPNAQANTAEQAAVQRAQGRNPALAVSEARRSVPAGTIRVVVMDAAGQPLSGAAVRIGVMRQAGAREEYNGTTDESGVYEKTDLPTGSGQAYRVTVPHEGATYATTPFRLEVDRGQLARVRRIPTTRDQRSLLMTVGQIMLEYKNERVHVTEQMRLSNLGGETIVFGDDGLHIPLPDGFTAFQSQDVMTDQRIVPDDEGFRLEGSITPGTITLTWAYDFPMQGDAMEFQRPLPFRTYRYRVLTDAAESMDLNVEGFPQAEAHQADGRRVLITSIERGPNDPELGAIRIRVSGIPTAGPLRYVALGGMLILFLFGFLLLRGTEKRGDQLNKARAKRRAELLDEVEELHALRDKGEVGPKFHTRRLASITDELASLERLDQAGDEDKSAKTSELGLTGFVVGAVGLLYAGSLYGVFISMQYFDTSPNWIVLTILAAFPVVALAFTTRLQYWTVLRDRREAWLKQNAPKRRVNKPRPSSKSTKR